MSSCEFEEIIICKGLEIENGVLEQIMSSCKFEKIIVVDGFVIENGMLGLDHDCYLSIIKFLISPILRKV
jgi:hypothetical protein